MKLDRKTYYFSIIVVLIGVAVVVFLSYGSEPYRTLLFFGISLLILIELIFVPLHKLSSGERLALVIFGTVGSSGVVVSILIWSSLLPSSVSKTGAGIGFFAIGLTMLFGIGA